VKAIGRLELFTQETTQESPTGARAPARTTEWYVCNIPADARGKADRPAEARSLLAFHTSPRLRFSAGDHAGYLTWSPSAAARCCVAEGIQARRQAAE
jgi:hypothetical protein